MWLIYLLFILDNIRCLINVAALISGLTSFVFIILSGVGACQNPDSYDALNQKAVAFCNKARKISLAIFIPALLLGITVPNSKQAAIMFSVGTTINYVKNNEKIKELPDKAVDCLNKYIDEYLSEDDINKFE